MEKICIQSILLCIVHTWCTELSLCLSLFTSLAICHLQYLVISGMQIQKHGEGLGNLVMCSDVRRIRRKTHGSHCLTVLIHNWYVHQTSYKARQCSLVVYSGFATQLTNHLIYMSFLYPQRTHIFRPSYCLQNYIACAAWRLLSMRWYSPCPHTELPEIHPFSITQYWLTTYYHTAY